VVVSCSHCTLLLCILFLPTGYSYRLWLPWSLVSTFLGCFLLIRRTWPTLLVSWHIVTPRPVMDWTDSGLLYAYRILLHLTCANDSLLVGLNICALAGCICSLIHLHWWQWPTLLLLFPSLLVLLTTPSGRSVLNQLLLLSPTLRLSSLLKILAKAWCCQDKFLLLSFSLSFTFDILKLDQLNHNQLAVWWITSNVWTRTV